MSAILLGKIWVHSVIDKWLKQTLYVIYFTKLIWGKVGIGYWFGVHLVIFQWIKQILCVSYLMSWLKVDSVIDQWLKQTLCVSYFTEFIESTFGNWPLIKAETMCYISYRVEPQLCHIWQLLWQHWCSIYWFLIHCMINNGYSIWYHLMRSSY